MLRHRSARRPWPTIRRRCRAATCYGPLWRWRSFRSGSSAGGLRGLREGGPVEWGPRLTIRELLLPTQLEPASGTDPSTKTNHCEGRAHAPLNAASTRSPQPASFRARSHRLDDLVQRSAECRFFPLVETVEHIAVPLPRDRHHLAVQRTALRCQRNEHHAAIVGARLALHESL